MSVPHRVADAITANAKIVLFALLLTTALVGAGMPMVDDDSSLDQYESDSEEGAALEYSQDNFTIDDAEDTTTVQLIVRGDNVLTKESLVSSLEFQQDIRNNESINATLAEDDPIVGVENLVATTAIREEQAAELEERGAELEERSAELEAQSEELEQRSAELEQRSEELDETAAELEAGLEETAEIELEYAELNASNEAGEISDEEYEQRSAELDAQLETVFEEATAGLTDEQAAQYDAAMDDVREIQSERVELEQANDAGELSEEEYEQRSAELDAQLEGVFLQGSQGVLEDEYAQLEADQEAIEEESEQLEAESDALEEESEQLEADQEELEDAGAPSIDEQIEHLESMNESTYEETVTSVLDDDDEAGGDLALRLMPNDYDPGSTSAESRMIFVTQSTDGADFQGPDGGDEEITATQLELQELTQSQDDEMLVFGAGIITDEIDRSMADSLAIVGPLALAFVVVALLIAYRDPLDIVLGVTGILAVLVWTFGFMGWTGISFNQMFVAIPVLLIGLSIDYAIHVFMRHREQREADGVTGDARGSMTVALAGVGVALVWVTATTVIGFLSNLVSPIGPIREFGVVSAVGILAALIVFGAMIPAAKVVIDSWLEGRGIDRRKRAFGTGGGRLADALSVGAVAARKAPLVVLVAVLLLTAGGVYGATQVDTSFEDEDFLADSPPAWTQNLPEPFQPGEYTAKDNLEYVDENFQRQDSEAQLLIRGDVTDDETLQQIEATEADAADSDVVYVLASGEADVRSPLATMENVAAENESFNESFQAADTNGDGVPDQDVEQLYDELYEVDAEAASDVVYRTDEGEYEAVRMIVSIQGDAPSEDTTDEMRALAADFESGGPWSVVATGDPIVGHVVEQDLLDTVLESLLITLVACLLFLTTAYKLTGSSATLGAITLLPVALAVSWILGTMYLIGMPFNVLTGMITSLTIGLGVAYSIHVSARYTLELERQGSVWDAMHTTVTGTGGALLGSAATTVGGFGVLAFAILPALEQFGVITALTIIYAFLASVIVLPTLLVLWTRYFGPDVSFESSPTRAPAASDGGVPDDGASDEGGEDR
ncbi:Patched family protein [Natronococcus pandeyae]|uniref:Patched family protein n=1 Tax=Natronococcus pandeyae TaxID=2055836 RepID=A0A8J8Q4W5_9EURY|nr:MMPL family transporter [Natronococcus pandeyae]TYL39122.1 Patched family protein [Natronococcus pandeyae]